MIEMLEKLQNIKQLLESITISESDKEKDDDSESKVDLEKDLTSTGNQKQDYNKNVIAVINSMIEGTATIEDLQKAVKNKKNG